MKCSINVVSIVLKLMINLVILGIDHKNKIINLEGETIKLQIW